MLTEEEYAECNLTLSQAALLKLHGYSIIKRTTYWLPSPFEIHFNQTHIGIWDPRNSMWNIYTRNELNIDYRKIVKELDKLLEGDCAF